MTDRSQSSCANLILRGFEPDDYDRLIGSLELIELGQHYCLVEFEAENDFIYFPLTGIASITSQAHPMKIEIGLVGREGFIGIPVVLSGTSWPSASFVQIPGSFLRMPANEFRQLILANYSMLNRCLNYVQAYLAQVSSTAIANASFNIEQRLARWLLMVLDRLDGSEIVVTHEFLAMMLAVRRPGITVATHVLEGEHAIKASRGKIRITDRSKLMKLAGFSYGTAEAEYQRLLGVTSCRSSASKTDCS